MSEQRPIGGRRSGGSRSRAARSWPQAGAASGRGSGRSSSSRPAPATATGPVPDPSAPAPEPPFAARTSGTRLTYRQLLLRGLSPDEAADLTAFLAGIAIGDRPWRLIEVNRILFLRSLAEGGCWGPDDGGAIPAD